MCKLTTWDIKIRSEEVQLKEEIIKEFNTLEQFAKKTNYTIKTVERNLKKGVSSKFLYKCSSVFGKSMQEIVCPVKKQIAEYIYNVFENIKEYNSSEDIKVINYLYDLSYEYNLEFEKILMERNLGRYYFNIKKYKDSIDNYKIAVEKAKDFGMTNYTIYIQSELGLTYFWIKELEKAKICLGEIEVKQIRENKFKNKALFKYHYTSGLVFMNLKEYNKAIEAYKNAYDYAYNKETIGGAIANMGLTYKNLTKYDLALEYYNKALKLYKNNNEKKSKMYNNIATVFLEKKQYNKALEFSEKAINLISKDNSYSSFVVYYTYIEIKIKLGQSVDKTLNKLIKHICEGDNQLVPKLYILQGLNSIVEISRVNRCYHELKNLLVKIDRIKKNTEIDNCEYIKDLEKIQENICAIIEQESLNEKAN